ncbi:MAG: hypothetical protein HYS08_10475 [Chlamydiae bacterium]|nr:hypothetical protein [Chlamydiota bacterium]MBI3266551.1 hypothetical protein [Chlamydiota bacterium]
MKRFFSLLSLSAFFCVSQAFASEGLILSTLDDTTAPVHQVTGQIGVAGEEQVDQSTLIHGPTFDAVFGIGDWAEAGIHYEILSLSDSPTFDDDTGSGDVRLRLKAVPLQTDWGRFGLAVIAKIPSADDGKGLGTDEADVVLKGLWGTHLFNDLHVFINLGAAIQGDPSTNSSQDDFFLWGVGAEYPLSFGEGCSLCEELWLIGEFEGAVGPEDNTHIAEGEFTDSEAEFRAGLMKQLPWFKVAATGSVGLTDESPDWGFRITFSRTFDLPNMTKE